MSQVIAEFEIMGLPKMTNGFTRQHWSYRAREAKKWKTLVFEQCHVHKITNLQLPSAVLWLTRYSAHEPDFDGLVSGFKHVIDGLVSADVILSDKISVISQPNYRWEYARPKKGKIKVRIESAA